MKNITKILKNRLTNARFCDNSLRKIRSFSLIQLHHNAKTISHLRDIKTEIWDIPINFNHYFELVYKQRVK